MSTPKLTDAEIETLSTAVAAALPGDWSIVGPVSHAYSGVRLSRDSDGLELSIGNESWKENGKLKVRQAYRAAAWKVEASGEFEDPTGYNESLPSINVSSKKTAERIAKDVERRLLADAEAMHVKALASVEGSNDYHGVCRGKLAALGLEPSGSGRNTEYKATVGTYSGGKPRAEVTARRNEIELALDNLNVEQAAHILEYLELKK